MKPYYLFFPKTSKRGDDHRRNPQKFSIGLGKKEESKFYTKKLLNFPPLISTKFQSCFPKILMLKMLWTRCGSKGSVHATFFLSNQATYILIFLKTNPNTFLPNRLELCNCSKVSNEVIRVRKKNITVNLKFRAKWLRVFLSVGGNGKKFYFYPYLLIFDPPLQWEWPRHSGPP